MEGNKTTVHDHRLLRRTKFALTAAVRTPTMRLLGCKNAQVISGSIGKAPMALGIVSSRIPDRLRSPSTVLKRPDHE
jgi:hypothetical protein